MAVACEDLSMLEALLQENAELLAENEALCAESAEFGLELQPAGQLDDPTISAASELILETCEARKREKEALEGMLRQADELQELQTVNAKLREEAEKLIQENESLKRGNADIRKAVTEPLKAVNKTRALSQAAPAAPMPTPAVPLPVAARASVPAAAPLRATLPPGPVLAPRAAGGDMLEAAGLEPKTAEIVAKVVKGNTQVLNDMGTSQQRELVANMLKASLYKKSGQPVIPMAQTGAHEVPAPLPGAPAPAPLRQAPVLQASGAAATAAPPLSVMPPAAAPAFAAPADRLGSQSQGKVSFADPYATPAEVPSRTGLVTPDKSALKARPALQAEPAAALPQRAAAPPQVQAPAAAKLPPPAPSSPLAQRAQNVAEALKKGDNSLLGACSDGERKELVAEMLKQGCFAAPSMHAPISLTHVSENLGEGMPQEEALGDALNKLMHSNAQHMSPRLATSARRPIRGDGDEGPFMRDMAVREKLAALKLRP